MDVNKEYDYAVAQGRCVHRLYDPNLIIGVSIYTISPNNHRNQKNHSSDKKCYRRT